MHEERRCSKDCCIETKIRWTTGCGGDRKWSREWELQDKKLKDLIIMCFPEHEKMCGRYYTTPTQDFPNHSKPMTMLSLWQRDAVSVINGKTLTWEDYHRLPWWVQSSPISLSWKRICVGCFAETDFRKRDSKQEELTHHCWLWRWRKQAKMQRMWNGFQRLGTDFNWQPTRKRRFHSYNQNGLNSTNNSNKQRADPPLASLERNTAACQHFDFILGKPVLDL